MRIYLLRGHGIFANDIAEKLPAAICFSAAVSQVRLDGVPVPIADDGTITLSQSLADGAHTLSVNGQNCEGVTVGKGYVRPAGADFRWLLPEVARFDALAARVSALEEKAKQNEVNWLL